MRKIACIVGFLFALTAMLGFSTGAALAADTVKIAAANSTVFFMMNVLV